MGVIEAGEISNLELILGFVLLFFLYKYIKKISMPFMSIIYVVVFYLVLKVLLSV